MKKQIIATLSLLITLSVSALSQTTKVEIISTSACEPLYVTLYATDPATCSYITSNLIPINQGQNLAYLVSNASLWPGGNKPGITSIIDRADVSYCTGVPYAVGSFPASGCQYYDFLTVGASGCTPSLNTTSCFEDSGYSGCSSCNAGTVINADYKDNAGIVTITIH